MSTFCDDPPPTVVKIHNFFFSNESFPNVNVSIIHLFKIVFTLESSNIIFSKLKINYF